MQSIKDRLLTEN